MAKTPEEFFGNSYEEEESLADLERNAREAEEAIKAEEAEDKALSAKEKRVFKVYRITPKFIIATDEKGNGERIPFLPKHKDLKIGDPITL